MAISINWATKVISIPQADLTWISGTLYELDTDVFRLTLKNLEDDEDGMAFERTHKHNTEVTVAGTTYARTVEIINGYSVEFEDGQYSVRLIGSNNNLFDVENGILVQNQVQVIPGNAAGLIVRLSGSGLDATQDQRLIDIELQGQQESYHDGVTVDTSSGNSGTNFPIGNPAYPVNNISDAVSIANSRGFTKLYFIGAVTINSGADLTGFILQGRSTVTTQLTINPIATVGSCVIRDAFVQGTLDGNTLIENCIIGDLDYVEGNIYQCALGGTITLGGSNQANFLDCWSNVVGSGTPIIDCGVSGRNIGIRNYSGGISIRNKAGVTEDLSIDMSSGHVILESTCTGGDIIVRGIGTLTDNSNGATVISDNFVQKGGLSQMQHNMLEEQWGLRGCMNGMPAYVRQTNGKPTAIEFGGVTINIAQPIPGGDVTLTRT